MATLVAELPVKTSSNPVVGWVGGPVAWVTTWLHHSKCEGGSQVAEILGQSNRSNRGHACIAHVFETASTMITMQPNRREQPRLLLTASPG
jgi:hypothetical protein